MSRSLFPLKLPDTYRETEHVLTSGFLHDQLGNPATLEPLTNESGQRSLLTILKSTSTKKIKAGTTWSWVNPKGIHHTSFTKPPPIKDWKVYNQKETYSCVGFTIADGLFNFQLYRNLNPTVNFHSPNSPNHSVKNTFSPRHPWMMAKELSFNAQPCSSADDSEGTDLYIAIRSVFQFHQLALKKHLPLRSFSGFLNKGISRTEYKTLFSLGSEGYAKSKASRLFMIYYRERSKVNSWFDVPNEPLNKLTFDLCNNWIATKGTIAMEIKVGLEFIDPIEFQADPQPNINPQGGGFNSSLIPIISSEMTVSGYKRFFHAVTIVGFHIHKNGTAVYLIKNSWGSKWAWKGYCWVTQEYIENNAYKLCTIL